MPVPIPSPGILAMRKAFGVDMTGRVLLVRTCCVEEMKEDELVDDVNVV